MGHDYLATNDGEPQIPWRWSLRHSSEKGWDNSNASKVFDVLYGRSSTSDLSENALRAIAGLVFHAMEQILDHDTLS